MVIRFSSAPAEGLSRSSGRLQASSYAKVGISSAGLKCRASVIDGVAAVFLCDDNSEMDSNVMTINIIITLDIIVTLFLIIPAIILTN
jgi:hypothetical protein